MVRLSSAPAFHEGHRVLSRAKNRSRGTARKTKRQSGRIGRWLLSLLVAGVVLVGGGAGAVWWWLQAPLVLEKSGIELSIEPGTPPQQVASAWVAAGVQTDPRFLYAWFRYSGQARKIRAGSYEIHAGVTPRELLDKMVRGDQVLEQLRLIEGWNFRQLRAAIAAAPALKQTTASMTDEQIMAALGAKGQAPEGRFFPDTYAYSLGVSDLTVLKRAHALMQKRLESAWSGRSDGLPLKSADEALVLASIVEKETGAAADRGLVAAVFVNRLKAGMPLQTDPTVIYGLGTDFDGNLRKVHLQTDTPFNTYTRGGLPPTPIAMPGLAALQATLHPTPSKALYFVSRGDGTSQFSEDLAAHNRAVNKYQRGR